MIASPFHQPSNIRCSPTVSKLTTPINVTDRIAIFEPKAPILFASTCHESHKTIVNCDGNTVRSFLRSIGEEEAPPTLPPKLWRWASEWKQGVQKRKEERKGNVGFYSLSESLDQLDAILYSDSTLLEIEALDLVSSTNRQACGYDRSEEKEEREGNAVFYSLSESVDQLDAILYSDSSLCEIEALDLVSSTNREECDYYRSEEKDCDPSVELAALESGSLELAKELESFSRLCSDNRDCSQTH